MASWPGAGGMPNPNSGDKSGRHTRTRSLGKPATLIWRVFIWIWGRGGNNPWLSAKGDGPSRSSQEETTWGCGQRWVRAGNDSALKGLGKPSTHPWTARCMNAQRNPRKPSGKETPRDLNMADLGLHLQPPQRVEGWWARSVWGQSPPKSLGHQWATQAQEQPLCHLLKNNSKNKHTDQRQEWLHTKGEIRFHRDIQ